MTAFDPDRELVLPNMPILVNRDGHRELYVFADLEGGQCTGRTKRKTRCANPVWDQGQVARYGKTFVGPHAVHYYGPLPGEVARKYFEQRCRVHDTPDAVAYCDPEWEKFDPHRHNRFVSVPHLSDFAEDLMYVRVPPVESLGRALRQEYSETERRRLAELLLAENEPSGSV